MERYWLYFVVSKTILKQPSTMTFMKSNDFLNYIESIVHQDTQEHKTHFDFTVSEIHKIAEAGSLDFGGSEFKEAETEIIEPQKNEDDDYGWWHLPKGTYQATMNERIREGQNLVAMLSPHPHTQQAGILANTTLLTTDGAGNPLTINFQVPEAGCNIKENARFAVIYFISL